MAQESLLGTMKELIGGGGGVVLATAQSSKKVKIDGDAGTIIEKDALVVPKHVGSFSKNTKLYLLPAGENSYFVLGKG